MKASILYSKLVMPQYFLSIVLMLFSLNPMIGQDRTPEGALDVVVSYNTPFSYNLGEDISWELKDENGFILANKKGDLDSYVFSKPGRYALEIIYDQNQNDIEHGYFPEKLIIVVKPIKLDFDFSTISFSRDIKAGQMCDDIIVKVAANFSSYNGESMPYNQGFTSFGVGSTISGQVRGEEVMLKPGSNMIEFLLKGQVEEKNSVQLNFLDFSGEVQPYTLTPKI
ncbi:MAG: hypothetical protein LC107_00005 [Chitinophagales bacterium]|nr:hypothetical protein [Chitinophagales bacterium]